MNVQIKITLKMSGFLNKHSFNKVLKCFLFNSNFDFQQGRASWNICMFNPYPLCRKLLCVVHLSPLRMQALYQEGFFFLLRNSNAEEMASLLCIWWAMPMYHLYYKTIDLYLSSQI